MNAQTLSGDFAGELNIVPEFEGTVLRLQHGLQAAHRNGRLGTQAVIVGSLFFSYSGETKTGMDRVCTRSYAAMRAELGCSTDTLARAISELKDAGFIERVRQSTYKYTGPDSGFDRVEIDMLTSELKLKNGSTKRLTKKQVEVFAYLYTNKDKEGYIAFSSAALAERLGMCKRCVNNALELLKNAGYITIAKEDKGQNRFKYSRWHLNDKLLNRKRKSARKARKEQEWREKQQTVVHKTQTQVEADKRNERAAYDSFTSARRQHAEALADMNKVKADADEAFRTADMALVGIEINIAFAEVRNEGNLPDLLVKKREFAERRAEALRRLKLTEADLMPRYECRKCSDTGYVDSGGLCPDCWEAFKKGRN